MGRIAVAVFDIDGTLRRVRSPWWHLHQHLGTAVHVTPCRTLANGRKAKGSITVDFYTTEELDRLLAILGLTENL